MTIGMRSGMCVAAFVGMASGVILGQSSGQDEVRKVEQQMHDAYVKHDVALFASLYAEDSTFTYSDGRVASKEERVRAFTGPYTDLKDDLQRIRVYGDTAIVNDRSDYTASTTKEHVALQITRVWLKRRGKWIVIAYQSTPVTTS
jgi:uncharacterized protein (TIGR02246 family)